MKATRMDLQRVLKKYLISTKIILNNKEKEQDGIILTRGCFSENPRIHIHVT